MNDQERSAYHEAGHAVVACHLGVDFARAGIASNEEAYAGGSGRVIYAVLSELEQACTNRKVSLLRRYSKVSMAGEVTECILDRATEPQLDRFQQRKRDWDGTLRCLDIVSGDTQDMWDVFRQCWLETYRYLRQPDNWKAVERVASELLERGEMNAAEVKTLIEPS